MLYTGIARDVEARFLVHKGGKGAKFTRANRPIKIVHREEFSSRSEALRREAAIKKMTKAEKEKLFRSS